MRTSASPALVFFGSLPRKNYTHSYSYERRANETTTEELCEQSFTSLRSFTDGVLPLLRRYVVQPAMTTQGFEALRVYGHAWAVSSACQMTHHLTEALKAGVGDVVQVRSVLATPLPGRMAKADAMNASSWQNVSDALLLKEPYMHALVSMKWALALLSGVDPSDHVAAYGSSSNGVVPRWWELPLSQLKVARGHERGAPAVLLLRWDTIFFTPFHWSLLNWALFYRANFCAVNVLAPVDDDGDSACAPLLPTYDAHCAAGDVPDYFFAANETVMHSVFASALEDFARKRFTRANCGVLHGVLAGLIDFAAAEHGLVLGRYRYHHFDCDIYREPLLDPRVRGWYGEPLDEGRVWKGRTAATEAAASYYGYDVSQPAHCSVCVAGGSGPRFCGCPERLLAQGRARTFPSGIQVPRSADCTLLPWRSLFSSRHEKEATVTAHWIAGWGQQDPTACRFSARGDAPFFTRGVWGEIRAAANGTHRPR